MSQQETFRHCLLKGDKWKICQPSRASNFIYPFDLDSSISNSVTVNNHIWYLLFYTGVCLQGNLGNYFILKYVLYALILCNCYLCDLTMNVHWHIYYTVHDFVSDHMVKDQEYRYPAATGKTNFHAFKGSKKQGNCFSSACLEPHPTFLEWDLCPQVWHGPLYFNSFNIHKRTLQWLPIEDCWLCCMLRFA